VTQGAPLVGVAEGGSKLENLTDDKAEDDVEDDSHGAVGSRRRTPYLARLRGRTIQCFWEDGDNDHNSMVRAGHDRTQ
jgi:hypothetical protein